MGSWFGTCGISQLPVYEGDEVAVFLLDKNKYGRKMKHNGCVYSHDLFVPIAPALFAEYADYGRIENIEYDKRVINLICEDSNELENLINEKKKFHYMMVHKELYEKLISHFGKEKYFYTKKEPLKAFLQKAAHFYINKKREMIKEGELFSQDTEFNRFKVELEELHLMNYYMRMNIYKDKIENDNLINSLIDLIIFNNMMSISRKLWIPQAGNGSQYNDYDTSILIGEFANNKIKKLREEW